MGPAAGLTVAVAADRGALAPRFAGAFGERILLRFADRGDFALAGLAARDVPTSLPPGRGVRAADGTVLQLAHAGLDAAALAATVSACAAQWPRPGRRSGAIVIRPLPTRVALTELAAPPGRFALGVAGDDAAPVSIDPFSGTSRLLVAGPPRSGRSTVLRVLARQAHAAGIATFVAAPPRSPLAADAAQLGIGRVDPADNPAPATGWPEPTLLLVDDCEAFRDTPAGDRLSAWAAARAPGLAVVAAGRTDELVTSYRGVAAEVRRSRCGILLRPGPVDGELLGVRLPRPAGTGPPGRGVAVGEPAWGEVFANGEPVPIQVAAP
jgi:S-DNA-T family DNA segregation ATPase FtsK/SpoIIIE